MDAKLIEYLNSGEAWLLVGSGPSIQSHLPSWRELGEVAFALVVTEGSTASADRVRCAIDEENYPLAFERAAAEVGIGNLLSSLRPCLAAHTELGQMYRLLARWPVPVYLTTNFDDEMNRHLVVQGEAYQILSNSADHMNLLLPDSTGLVVKLHGDLTTDAGLVLTSSQYDALAHGPEWKYWRTRMTSVFQMNRVIVVGYSLNDPHIRAALEAAKAGTTISREVCWLAPNAPTAEVREYLERYKVRVISYPSTNGDHRGLATLLADISKFVPARTTTRIRRDVDAVVTRASQDESAATAVYVFNRLSPHVDMRALRIDVAVAAAEAGFTTLEKLGRFSLREGLTAVGWSEEAGDQEFERLVQRRLRRSGMVVEDGDRLHAGAIPTSVRQQRERFVGLRSRFRKSVAIRLRRDYPNLTRDQAETIAVDLDDSLAGFFREGGLTLATLLFSNGGPPSTVPSSIVAFITEAAAKYDNLEMRHAFWHGAIGSFVDAGSAEREYLGRLAQGFFAFHAIGAYGEVAAERLANAQSTVWLLDSNVQIPAIALGAPTNRTYSESLARLHKSGVRLFSTARLFDETFEHLGFARQLIARYGPDSPYVIQAAAGEPPYRRQNEFLQGFIRWQAAGNASDWEAYLFEAFGHRDPGPHDVAEALAGLGVEIVEIKDWPGFVELDYVDVQTATDKIKQLMSRHRPTLVSDVSYEQWLDAKVPPEAEAWAIVTNERAGRYRVLSGPGIGSPSWFVSSTAVVNAIDDAPRITWRPEAFLAFVGTLVPPSTGPSADRAFEVVLWSLAEAGINPIDEGTIETVFGRTIDQATIKVAEQREAMGGSLASEYAEAPGDVIKRLPPSRRLLATLQLANELLASERAKVKTSEEREAEATSRARAAEGELTKLARFKRKYTDRQAKLGRRARRHRP